MEILYFVSAFIVSLLLGKPTIKYLNNLKLGQEIREDGPQSHLKKAGTPTMGGLFFIATFLLLSLIYTFTFAQNKGVVFFIASSALLYGITGYMDDMAKIKKKNNLGLTAREKFFMQLLFSILIIFIAHYYLKIDTSIILPITKGELDLKLVYYPIVILMITGTTNGVNLSDGLDGLSAGVSAIILVGLGILSGLFTQTDVRFLSFILSGALLGFLVYNFNPAKVFMGDTGSLFIGGFLAASFMVLRMPFHLIILGLFYVVETLSVIAQVLHYKRTKKRLFLMAPLHHHFEMKGNSEKSIVLASYVISVLIVIVTIALC
ncbi:MAG: phospho-N-acetylmuramoyl-pentapeptide-transferase [Tissierellia bacterium]|nr:phospho-N-acetylmuramoyl-pentapeptide-transferase [Tissierellia bacterium]